MKLTRTAAFLLLVNMVAFADSETDRLLANVQKTYQSLKAVCADFSQTFYWKLTGEVQRVEGRVCALGGNQFKIETPEQVVINDGKALWTLNKTNNQVVIDRPENAAEDNPFIKNFLDKYLRDYTARPLPSETAGERCVLMTAKEEDQYVPRIKVWIDEKSLLIQKIEQTDLNDNVTVFELQRIDTSVKLTPRDFSFSVPAGADVIDMR